MRESQYKNCIVTGAAGGLRQKFVLQYSLFGKELYCKRRLNGWKKKFVLQYTILYCREGGLRAKFVLQYYIVL